MFGTSGRHCVSTAKPILTQGLEWVFAVVGVVAFYVFCFLWHDILLFFCFLWQDIFVVLFSVAHFFLGFVFCGRIFFLVFDIFVWLMAFFFCFL